MRKLAVFLLVILFLFFPRKVFAVSVTITNLPASVGFDAFNLTATVSGATPGTNYLRIDIYKDGTTNYFGQTFNGSDWVSDADGTHYFPITIAEDKTWTGEVQAKIGNTLPASYDGTGDYKLRIRRYTAGGNYNNDEAKASAVAISLTIPTPTLIPTNTPTPTKVPTPTHSPTPTRVPTPTKVPTPTRVSTNTPFPTPTKARLTRIEISKELQASAAAVPTAILGASISAEPIEKVFSQPKTMVQSVEQDNRLQLVALVFGAAMLAGCGILAYRRKKSDD